MRTAEEVARELVENEGIVIGYASMGASGLVPEDCWKAQSEAMKKRDELRKELATLLPTKTFTYKNTPESVYDADRNKYPWYDWFTVESTVSRTFMRRETDLYNGTLVIVKNPLRSKQS
jgi:hypothetical protein